MNNRYMIAAIEAARRAGEAGEIPVGAVIVKDNTVIATAGNTRENNNIITGHAEINAINSAAQAIGTWKLDDCDLYVTLEPCPMCAAAIAAARINNIYFGACDRRAGALESMMRLYDSPLEHKPQFFGGIMEEETAALLSDFFKEKRKRGV